MTPSHAMDAALQARSDRALLDRLQDLALDVEAAGVVDLRDPLAGSAERLERSRRLTGRFQSELEQNSARLLELAEAGFAALYPDVEKRR